MDFADKVRSYNDALCSGFALQDFQRNIRALRTAPSGGRVESEFQGLSGMDAARAAMGHGWPFAAGP